MRPYRGTFAALVACALLPAAPARAQDPSPAPRPAVAGSVKHDVSPALSSIVPLRPRAALAPREHPVKRLPPLPRTRAALARDGALQPAAPAALGLATRSFEGVGVPGYSVAHAPADTTGAAGPTQYVQWVNTAFAVFEKATGNRVYGPADGQTLWSGFGGPCEHTNDGDPIVLYDRLAGRWLLTQFAVDGGPPYFQCIAVSQTSDATGPYARYAYQFEDFNDYPKFGVWPDGYYASFNMFGPSAFLGARVCAFERDKMLSGAEARMVCFDVADGGLLPADLEGTRRPPANAPGYFVNFGPDRLNVWRFRVYWQDTSRSTLAGPAAVAVKPFEPACPVAACIAQPGTGYLDSLGDRLMYRLAYRRRGSVQSLVLNHSVANGPSAAIRWYELRRVSTAPVVFQQGTYAPDGISRWMGSAAMDKKGNIALGYSVSSSSVSPGIRVTGRRRSDPLHTLRGEVEVVAGAGAQGLQRWGDYSALTVDPVDDCTFWFTTQYIAAAGRFNWQTRIASFKFPDCN